MADKPPHILVIEARFYDDISDELLRGAEKAIEEASATHERITVPGALENTGALAMAIEAMERGTRHFDVVV